MAELDTAVIENLLMAVGKLLKMGGHSYAIVVVGGASLNLLRYTSRTTDDVDIVARIERAGSQADFVHPDPLPGPLQDAIATVARDFVLPSGWMNTQVARQWREELLPYLFRDIEWRHYEALEVGLASRSTLIALKLHAAADRDRESVHYQDLVALAPTEAELEEARLIVLTQDAGTEFPQLVNSVIEHVKRDTRRD